MPYKVLNCDKERPDRTMHCTVKSEDAVIPTCSKFTLPGDSSERSCAFHGCRVVICNQIKNVVHLVHSPMSCAYHSWDYRSQSYGYGFTTDLQESDIIFGGEEKLFEAILKAAEEFNPDAVFVYETCTPALIGNDIQSVAKKASEKLGIPVLAFNCAGFKGANQNAGHKIANEQLFQLIGTRECETTPYDVNLIGDFGVKDAKVIEEMLGKIGVRVLCSFTGNASIDKIRVMHKAKVNIVHCMKSSMNLAKMMREKYGIPYVTANFFGIESCSTALRRIGMVLGIDEEKIEKVISENLEQVKPKLEFFKEKLEGKKVFICHGAQRVLHYINPLKNDLGMEIVGIATYFGNEENYEKILKRVPEGTIIIDNPNTHELEEIILECKPDIFVSDNKTRQLLYKLGTPFIYGRGIKRSYVGFDGFVNFAEEVYGTVNSKVWKLIR
ncbi:MAG: nitrogenase molybdenum-iron protein alpha chain [Methanothermococcus sp.]|uniref:nitrogenase component 1 n=1 Tax=Methanothermococcus TaxID=155862 RepID=UPI0003792409|nr:MULTISPECIES: nitrogenase component 1 [Methanothermococcus]MDK2789565.1 nitrogenase molybdenum-iron protein alpha chain [Methanothermococcus sp.]